MLSRMLCISLALAMLITSGCRSRSNYQPSSAPTVVGVTPVAPCSNPVPVIPVAPPFGR